MSAQRENLSQDEQRASKGSLSRRSWPGRAGLGYPVGTLIALVLLGAFLAWSLRQNGTVPPPPRAPTAATIPELAELGASFGFPIYWVGPKNGYTYEISSPPTGIGVALRYLPPEVPVGSTHPYLTITTHRLKNAYTVTRRVALRPASVAVHVAEGIAFSPRAAPNSVYLAFPGANYQVIVTDPAPAVARNLVVLGLVTQVRGVNSSVHAVVASKQQLKASLAATGGVAFWAGVREGMRYELTRGEGGSTFIRYLPKTVLGGTNEPFLTIGSRPLERALAITRRESRASGSVAVSLHGGGVAFYRKARPTSVYFALPGAKVQVEVYDPTADLALSLVEAGDVTAIR